MGAMCLAPCFPYETRWWVAIWLVSCFRFLRLDDLESFLEDAERAAADNDDDRQSSDAEDRLGEGRPYTLFYPDGHFFSSVPP